MQEVGDESAIEVHKAYEELNFGDVLWCQPVLDAGDLDGIHFHMSL